MISETLKTIIEALQHITNIYSLVGFLCLLSIFLIAQYQIEPSMIFMSIKRRLKIPRSIWLRKITVFFLFVITITMIGLFLNDIRWKTISQKEALIEKDGRIKLHQRVEVELMDITTLKSEKYNRTLGDDEEREHIYRVVFEKAGLKNPRQAARNALTMSEEQWNKFLGSLSKSASERIGHTPFARFRIYIDGERDFVFENRYFFKGQKVSVVEAGKGPLILKFRLIHVFDVYDFYSDEREAVIVKLIK